MVFKTVLKPTLLLFAKNALEQALQLMKSCLKLKTLEKMVKSSQTAILFGVNA
jgi:hypothetical protein